MLYKLHYKHSRTFLTFYYEYLPKINAEGREGKRLFGKRGSFVFKEQSQK